jgi:lipoate---protein ligase
VRRGDAGDLHASWPSVDAAPTARAVAVCEPEGACVVLGSTQPDDAADPLRAGERGIAVARRRTGGGAVFVDAEDPVWIDLWLPAGDPLVSPDIGRSFDWLGEAWVAALAELGLRGLSRRRDAGAATTEWSSLVCFGGTGRGEVLDADGRKIVGLAQRRTRAGSWFQSACLLRWDPGPLLEALSLTAPERLRARRELASVAAGIRDLGGAERTGPPGRAGRAAVTSALIESLP